MDLETFLLTTRLNKPLPILLLTAPCLSALILLSQNGFPSLSLTIIAVAGGICARTTGCMLNDLMDLHIDKKVERTKNRALASNKVKESEFYTILSFFSIASYALLATLSLKSIIAGLLTSMAILFYPLTKRFFFFPQLVLGIVFNFGIIIIALSTDTQTLGRVIVFYFGVVSWTVGYDTVYAMQDAEDDKKIKINSSAINFENPKKLVSRSYDICTLLWLSTGTMSKLGNAYYICIFFIWLMFKKQLSLLEDRKYSDVFNSNIFVAIFLIISFFLGKK